LDKKSGLANYFKEIVKNASSVGGDKVDLNKYGKLMEEYDKTSKKRNPE
jgi:hypothetical protein